MTATVKFWKFFFQISFSLKTYRKRRFPNHVKFLKSSQAESEGMKNFKKGVNQYHIEPAPADKIFRILHRQIGIENDAILTI